MPVRILPADATPGRYRSPDPPPNKHLPTLLQQLIAVGTNPVDTVYGGQLANAGQQFPPLARIAFQAANAQQVVDFFLGEMLHGFGDRKVDRACHLSAGGSGERQGRMGKRWG